MITDSNVERANRIRELTNIVASGNWTMEQATELKGLQDAQAAEKRAAEQAAADKRVAEHKAAWVKIQTLSGKVATALAEAINAKASDADKVMVVFPEETNYLHQAKAHLKLVMGEYTTSLPAIEQRTINTGSWRGARLTDEYNICFNSHGGHFSRKTFPPKKDGTHNYAKIAEEFLNRRNALRQVLVARANKEGNYKQAKALMAGLEDIRYKSGFSIEATEASAEKLSVSFRIAKMMTPEEARAFYEQLKAMGLVN